MRTHTRERPYQCDVCGRRLSVVSNMRSHRDAHPAVLEPTHVVVPDVVVPDVVPNVVPDVVPVAVLDVVPDVVPRAEAVYAEIL